MLGRDYILLGIIFFAILISKTYEKERIIYKCGKNNLKTKPKLLKNYSPIDKSDKNVQNKRKLDADGFHDFSIYIDLTNINLEISKYRLTRYKSLFLNGFNKVIKTLESLLKVKDLNYAYTISDRQIMALGIYDWDKKYFGDSAAQKGYTTYSLGVDLIIFGKFLSSKELGEKTLAAASAEYVDVDTDQPVYGIVYLNKDVDYSLINSQEYFESIILHEFTHILGFDINYFLYFNNILIQKDKYGIQRYYINSTRVVNIARKYFNCDNIIGVELENYGDSGTAGSHWEARILLGDYMNGVIYTEEQVISEFTLALLEDTGYYKANYYTGGLMRYGKNKGCDFVTEKCVNDYEINPNFENEFFDYFNQKFLYEPSCSSGRQSRTYKLLFDYYDEIPIDYQYYNDSFLGGSSSADYCPVAADSISESRNIYYIGHCSNVGTGEYGSKISYYDIEANKTYYYKSSALQSIIEEKQSTNSFCYLSSLVKNTKDNYELISSNIRAICYETFCSSKSLTIKIDNDYFVCPRAGGKITVRDYEGYFLCPDYNLMCSGTVLCNNMFDCVDKKSTIKEESYNYDYIIKTSQNIPKSELEEIDDINNYELSEDGECPQYCKLCTNNKKCLECKNDYLFAGRLNEEIVKCVDRDNINIGHYKFNDTFYYECIDNCDICSDSYSCTLCNAISLPLFDKCIKIIEGCEDYVEDGTCLKCSDNYAFIEDDRTKCILKSQLIEYYSKDGGISYIKCDGNGENHINNCKKCHSDKNIICDECNENKYNLLSKCVNKIENCEIYNEIEENCKKCANNYAFVEDNYNICFSNEILDGFYTLDNGINYYNCNGEGENHIQNCKKCHYNEKLECDTCISDYHISESKDKCERNASNSEVFFYFKKYLIVLICIFIIN